MHKQLPPMRAAIDIGSNTIHVVVARCMPSDLDIVADEVELVRIGESVTATGEISPQKRDAAITTLKRYKALAEKHAAEQIFVVATEAIRQANNSAKFLTDIQRETGLSVHLISGHAEATLTFYGATYEETKESGATKRLGVMDLGGGSTELVTAQNMHISWQTSIPIGSGWLHDRYLPSNPPTTDELSIAHTFLHTYFQGMRIKQSPPMLIVTGGSANSLLYLVQQAYRLDMSINRLTRKDLMRCEGLLSALTAEEISQQYGQPVGRTRILLAGALIIQAVMARLHLNKIAVSPHGIREGVLLARERYGEHWLEQVEKGTPKGKDLASKGQNGTSVTEDMQNEPFIQSGQRMLHERVKKLLEWRDEVLKHEDVEAVHKMRVASRRLRAALDAYESCCNPKQFKKAYRQIKNMADILGNARDTDVMLQGLHEKLEQVPHEEQAGIQWMIDRLHTYRKEKQETLEAFFETLDEDALRQQVTSCISEGASSHGKS